MIRGTTPTYTFTIKDQTVDLSQASNVYATFEQDGREVTKTGNAVVVGTRTVEVFLTQKESFKFKEGAADVQINWTYPDPLNQSIVRRAATKWRTVPVDRQLLERVIE